MIETLEVKNAEGFVVELVFYNTESLEIEDIKLWSESAQNHRYISVWQFRADQPNDFIRLETKVIAHEAQRLIDLKYGLDDFTVVTLTKEAL